MLTILLSSCSSFYAYKTVYTKSQEFDEYVLLYLHYKLKYLQIDTVDYPIVIEFTSFSGLKLGDCTIKSDKNSTRRIRIDKNYWKMSDDNGKIQLMFHELGHCDLNWPHQDTELGIMNTKLKKYKITENNLLNFFWEGK